MLMYDFTPAPSPRRVRIFLAEKGLTVPTEQVDLRSQGQFTDAFRALNPECAVPCLVLDDGTTLTESMAICRYFEALHPEPALFGRGAVEQARVEQWSRRAEFEGYLAAAECYRNRAPLFADRALPGSLRWPQIPALIERGEARVHHFFEILDRQLASNAYVAGASYSVADITALVAVDFAGWSKLTLPESLTHARRWHATVSARPSAVA